VERELATDIFWTVASPETCEALVMRRARNPIGSPPPRNRRPPVRSCREQGDGDAETRCRGQAAIRRDERCAEHSRERHVERVERRDVVA
jgi:hypothetical protein